MRIVRPRERRGSEERLLPLINVVFLLLVFFMISGQIAQRDPRDVTPPASAQAGPSTQGAASLLLTADGDVLVDGHAVSREDLARPLAARGALDEVRIKADRSGDSAVLVGLLADLKVAGVQNVALLAVAVPR